MPTSVWIDTDPAVGVPERDVDDGFALLAALRSPELRVTGISTVFGNTTLEQAHRVAETALREAAAGDVPLHRGAAAATHLGVDTDASVALAAALRAEPLDIVALGPLTNIATVLLRHPRLAVRMRGVVAVAGRRPGQRFFVGPSFEALPDLNVECDPGAVSALLATSVPLTLAGFEVSSHVWLRRPQLDRLAAGPSGARWLADPAQRWLALWRDRFRVDGFHPFDTLAVGCLLGPSLVDTEPAVAALVSPPAGSSRPPELHAAPDLPEGRPVRYATRPRADFADELMARLLAG